MNANINETGSFALMVRIAHDYRAMGVPPYRIVNALRLLRGEMTRPTTWAERNPWKIVLMERPERTVAQFETRRRAVYALETFIARDEMKIVYHPGRLAED